MPKVSLDQHIADRLSEHHQLQPNQLETARKKAEAESKSLHQAILELGFVSEWEMAGLLSGYFRIPIINLDHFDEIPPEVLKFIPKESAQKFLAVPVDFIKNYLTVVMADPLDVLAVDRLRRISKCQISPVYGTKTAIVKAIKRYYEHAVATGGLPADQIIGAPRKEGEKAASAMMPQSPVIQMTDTIIKDAIRRNASDIHFEPAQNAFYVRFRIDGILYDYQTPVPKEMEPAITSRIKIMANLDITEKRLPQDGRIAFASPITGKEISLRISTFPTIYGENVVVRILDTSRMLLQLSDLGFTPDVLDQFRKVISRPTGIVLVTGPTGSGKTSTLYSVIREIHTTEKHIMTLEDPVEYRLDRVRQSQIDVKSGLTFASGLRSMVRQDPDVIMIGEIRDTETAAIAIQSALTGHLVFSTLHTNDAASAITRLIDMGIEPFLISSSITGILAQRLVRVLCSSCKEGYMPDDALLEKLGLPQIGAYLGKLINRIPELEDAVTKDRRKLTFYRKKGCPTCNHTGYQSRVGIFELILPDDDIRKLIVERASAEAIKHAVVRRGMKDLREDGLIKILEGKTSVEEVLRVTQEL